MVEPIEQIQPFTWDISQITDMLSSGIEVGAYSVLVAGLVGFVLSKFIKLMTGRG